MYFCNPKMAENNHLKMCAFPLKLTPVVFYLKFDFELHFSPSFILKNGNNMHIVHVSKFTDFFVQILFRLFKFIKSFFDGISHTQLTFSLQMKL